jgi:hypothetical protein
MCVMHHVLELFADNDDTLTLYFATFKYRRVYAGGTTSLCEVVADLVES